MRDERKPSVSAADCGCAQCCALRPHGRATGAVVRRAAADERAGRAGLRRGRAACRLPNQAPWALLGLGYLAAAAGYVTAGSTWPVVPGDVAQLLFAASALLVLTAIIGFATSDHEEWTAALLHGLLLTTIGWVAVWQFDPRHALTGRLRWQPSYEIVDTLGVVAGIVSVGVGLTLALRARQGATGGWSSASSGPPLSA
ncbi:hypothetical protein [Arsenicicoccus piscis]|uniref:Uncharacterized protein n=1 Tax=Arsenicicoccus piscis TaxID=673954 RepID=A0ABQ6HT41_9MICO|nr:hypothetical protein [Arsenicicoccus piscis]GMA21152.1 hypothetical protein GCM10025862_31730 [Arsenicicoccus piscis]